MKICFIGDARSIHIINWLKYFAEKGHSVSLITDTENNIEGVKIFNIGECRPGFQLPLIAATLQIYSKINKIKKLLTKIKPDIVHSHYATNYGFLAAKANVHPLVLTCHGSDILLDLNKDMTNRFFVNYALKKSDLITAPSQQMARQIRLVAGEKKPLTILQYGINTTQFSYKNRSDSQRLTFISTRALLPKYKIELIIKAFAKLHHEYPDVKLIITGDGSLAESLKKLTQKIGLEKRITFTGNIDNREIHKYYHQALFYITASPTDGLSISLLEAMACGCYPILPDNASNSEVKEQGFQLGLYRVNEVDSLFFRMKQVVQKQESLDYILQNNAKLVDEHFSRRVNLAKVAQLYQKLCGGY